LIKKTSGFDFCFFFHQEIFKIIEPQSSEEDEPSSPVAKKNPILSLFHLNNQPATTERTPAQRLHIQLMSYKNEMAIPLAPLSYWKCSTYDVLKIVALAVLSCQPTSTPSERAFSDTGYQMWERRFILKIIYVETNLLFDYKSY
jgi:hypothetical protein